MSSYILRNIDKPPNEQLWVDVKAKATADGLPLRGLILALLRAYVAGRVSVELPKASDTEQER